MSIKHPDQLIARIESHIECWKQFNYFINLARARKFGPEDESHFLELKKIIGQDLEMILAAIEVPSSAREETIALLGHTPSLRCLSEMDGGSLPGLEDAWHKLYIGWHSILGQIATRRRKGETDVFGGKK
ncbi:MAG: hypothetical protein ABSE90_04290 [Verrucomicrobiota bacterium]|jgi:hypothetical protein